MTATASVSLVSATADVLHAEFPLLIGEEHLGVSFQVRPTDAPAFAERMQGVCTFRAGTGELYETYQNVTLIDSVNKLGLKLVGAYIKHKATTKGPRSVVYFWFAPESDPRNLEPDFFTYARGEFERLAGHVYVAGESFTNTNGPACIVLKGVAQCPAHTALSLVEGELKSVN